ncbi:hypothetical protein TBCG_00328 [Mycobacterium tuberculosis C]|nr:hypothetical protein TBCG_00328 [Mycobacterium tuberculosis C]
MAKMAGSHAAVAAAHGNFQTMTTSEIATVLAWHDALNAADIETLVALSTDDIDIGDAHGAVQGHDALRGWASSLTTTAELGRMYVHHGVVVRRTKDHQRRRSGHRQDRRRGVPWWSKTTSHRFSGTKT